MTHKLLYNSPYWGVLIYVMEHPELSIKGSQLTNTLPHISKSAIYKAIQVLKEVGILIKEEGDNAYTLNRDSIGLHSLMCFHNATLFQPLVNGISDLSSKIILFGSRASGEYSSDSDYDLLVVTKHASEVRRIVHEDKRADQIQLIIKTPEEWLDFHKGDPELYRSVQKGIVLWDRK